MKAARQVDIRELARRIRAIEEQSVDAVHTAEMPRVGRAANMVSSCDSPPSSLRHLHAEAPRSLTVAARTDSALTENALPTGWPGVDAALGGGLSRGALHEWFGLETCAQLSVGRVIDPPVRGSSVTSTGYKPTPQRPVENRRHREPWSPPLSILAHLAWQAAGDGVSPPWTLWVGPQCFPYPHVLTRCRGADHRLLDRSIFVRARNMTERLWAAELALRCRAVGAAIVDASQFSMPATRRIQLLARAHGCIVLAARPMHECGELSAAHSRWRVHWAMSQGSFAMPRWRVELLRCKGTRVEDRPGWILEQDRATGAIGVSAALADATGEETPVARARALGD